MQTHIYTKIHTHTQEKEFWNLSYLHPAQLAQKPTRQPMVGAIPLLPGRGVDDGILRGCGLLAGPPLGTPLLLPLRCGPGSVKLESGPVLWAVD